MVHSKPADADPDDLYDDLTPTEWDELYDIQTQYMFFKGIAAGLETWEKIYSVLQQRIQEIEELKAKGARIIENIEGMLLFQVPGNYGAYAIFEKREAAYYHFRIHTGDLVRVLIDPSYDPLADVKIGSRIVVLLTSEGEVLNFRVSVNPSSKKAKIKSRGDNAD
ncbi:MAG: hypothetical protein ACFE89_06110 [Candidatus Hodarchaeota archaeon]